MWNRANSLGAGEEAVSGNQRSLLEWAGLSESIWMWREMECWNLKSNPNLTAFGEIQNLTNDDVCLKQWWPPPGSALTVRSLTSLQSKENLTSSDLHAPKAWLSGYCLCTFLSRAAAGLCACVATTWNTAIEGIPALALDLSTLMQTTEPVRSTVWSHSHVWQSWQALMWRFMLKTQCLRNIFPFTLGFAQKWLVSDNPIACVNELVPVQSLIAICISLHQTVI